jgi:hypothetical protein
VKTLKEQFLSPADEFSPIPFWFWNDTLNKETLKRQLDDFYAKGIRGFVLHPRKGLPITQKYLSETFLDYVEYIVEEAAKLKMTVFLYDEAMYPSGAANGMVVKSNPAYAAKGLQMFKAEEGESAPEFGEGNWFVAKVPAEDGGEYYFSLVYSEGTIRGVHEGEDDGEPNAPKAADLLDINAMKLFIHLTHEAYYARLSKYFGSTIVAMFTDEPSILGRCAKRGLIPWTHGFLEHYLACGGKIEDLPVLFEKETTETRGVHQIYHHALKLWMAESYFRPISDWCVAHGIALSGHPHNSNDIGFLKFFQIPCQDMVWRYVDPELGNGTLGHHSTMGKCSSDSARHRGRRRNGNEVFGACGLKNDPWKLTSSDMKWYLDWLFVRGVNLIIPHAFYYSLRDDRVNERPPDVGPNSIWWKHYDQITSYTKRLCWLNTDSHNVTDVAVLCTKEHLPWEAMQTLYDKQIEFNYLEAELLESCTIKDGALCIGQQCYKVLLVEEGLYLTEEQKESLKKLTDQGIEVISVGKSCDAECLEKLEKYNPLALKVLHETKDLRVTHVYKEGKHFYLMVNEGNASLYFHASTALKGRMELWNPWDGSIKSLDADEQIPVKLGYRESLILAVEPLEAVEVPCEGGEVVRVEALASETRRYITRVNVNDGEEYTYAEVIHNGEIVALLVDNVQVDVKMWAPYRFDVTKALAEGKHTVSIEITDSMGKPQEHEVPSLILYK